MGETPYLYLRNFKYTPCIVVAPSKGKQASFHNTKILNKNQSAYVNVSSDIATNIVMLSFSPTLYLSLSLSLSLSHTHTLSLSRTLSLSLSLSLS